MLLAEVVHGQHLLPLTAPTAVAIVDPFVYSVSIAVPVLQLISAAFAKHARQGF